MSNMNAKRLLASILLTGTLTAQLAGGVENSAATASKLVIHADQGKDTISRNIYGHFP